MGQKERNLKNISVRNSTMLAKEALQTGKSVYDLVLDQKFLSKEEIEKILSPEEMIRPRRIDKD